MTIRKHFEEIRGWKKQQMWEIKIELDVSSSHKEECISCNMKNVNHIGGHIYTKLGDVANQYLTGIVSN